MLYYNNSARSIVVECLLCPSYLSPVTDYLFIVIPHPLVEKPQILEKVIKTIILLCCVFVHLWPYTDIT